MTAQPSAAREVLARWWPVAVAVLLFALFPVIGLAFAILMAFMRRGDRAVAITLIVLAVLELLWISLFVGVSGGGIGIGG